MQQALRWEPAPRAAPALVVVALHVAGLALLLAASAIRDRIATPRAMEVAFVPAERPAPPPPPPRFFRPQLRQPVPVSVAAPEIQVTLPRVEPVAPPAAAPNPAPMITAVAAPPAAIPPPAPPVSTVEPPRFDLAYLRNPPPRYPSASKRAREQGRVILRVLVTPEGTPEAVEVRTSSGFERLDQAAIDAVRRWRFSPARRGAQPVAAYALVPVLFALET